MRIFRLTVLPLVSTLALIAQDPATPAKKPKQDKQVRTAEQRRRSKDSKLTDEAAASKKIKKMPEH